MKKSDTSVMSKITVPMKGQTKLSDKEWRDRIVVEVNNRGGTRYYSAICPICSYEVDIPSTRTLAVEKVASHIQNAHSDALT